ncbi:MAG: hypothetical protein L0323_10505, partial [Planctomycetes bacterium]|nr:hypothetical protein [Planctomycetota bacterium]
DVAGRLGRVADRGGARLFECADEFTARLLENEGRMRGLCLRAGERHLVVPAGKEGAFRRALLAVGYPAAPLGARDKAPT